MIRKIFIVTLFLFIPAFPQSVNLITPNGGESFNAGQEVTISWTKRSQSEMAYLFYSVDNGTLWNFIAETDKSAFPWIVPHLKKGTDHALIKVGEDAMNFPEVSIDTSDGNFTIKASPPDEYEPNDGFSSASPISIGDSVVKHAIVMGGDSAGFDDDYYKVNLSGGKFTTISIVSYRDQLGFPMVQLFDASKQQIAEGGSVLELNIVQSGIYYLKISYDEAYHFVQWYEYGISILQGNGPSITLITPNGGESFSAEQTVPIKWQANFTQSNIGVQYSIDSGKSWRNAWYDIADSSSPRSYYSWRVPHLKHRTDRALFKVFAQDSTNPAFDVSNGTFTILASPKDAYEPNDNFAIARAVEVGDSAVKNAIVMRSYAYNDSTGIDTSLTDNDFFKVSLQAGKVATISVVDLDHYYTGNDFEDMIMGPVLIRLFDASKNQIGMSFQSLSCNIPQAGVYYFQISSGEGTDYWNRYSLSIFQSDLITLISPNGGENFRTGQKITVSLTADPLLGELSYYYSVNNGKSWNEIGHYQSGSEPWTWTIPALKTRTDQALFKVSRFADSDPLFDVSNGTFTIQAAQPDAYEPNDVMSSAYPIAIGDSVVKNASTCLYSPVDSFMDVDCFKVNLTSGSLVRIRDWVSDADGSGQMPRMDVFGAFGQLFPIPGSIDYNSLCYNQYYNIIRSDVYYIQVWPAGFWGAGNWEKYGLSIKSITTLFTQTSVLDTGAMQFDSSLGVYRSQLIADTAKLTIDFTLNKKYDRQITTMVLVPKDFAPLPDEKAKVKAIAISFDYPTSEQIAADITIPYGFSDLNGYPEESLAVACQDNSASDLWDSVASSIDTVKHQIIVHMPSLRFNFFQVYVKSDGASISNHAKAAPGFEIATNFLSQKQSIVVHLSLPNAANAEMRLYNVQGKCLRKGSFAAGAGSSTFLWNISGLGSGKYFLNTKAGTYHATEAILIMH